MLGLRGNTGVCKTVNPLNGDVSDSQLNAGGGQNDHAWKYTLMFSDLHETWCGYSL